MHAKLSHIFPKEGLLGWIATTTDNFVLCRIKTPPRVSGDSEKDTGKKSLLHTMLWKLAKEGLIAVKTTKKV